MLGPILFVIAIAFATFVYWLVTDSRQRLNNILDGLEADREQILREEAAEQQILREQAAEKLIGEL